jgi:ribosomal protein L21E
VTGKNSFDSGGKSCGVITVQREISFVRPNSQFQGSTGIVQTVQKPAQQYELNTPVLQPVKPSLHLLFHITVIKARQSRNTLQKPANI